MELIRWLQAAFRRDDFLIEHQMRMVMGICRAAQGAGLRPAHRQGTPGGGPPSIPEVLEAYLGQEAAWA